MKFKKKKVDCRKSDCNNFGRIPNQIKIVKFGDMRHEFDSYTVRECQSGEAPLQFCENIAQ